MEEGQVGCDDEVDEDQPSKKCCFPLGRLSSRRSGKEVGKGGRGEDVQNGEQWQDKAHFFVCD